MNETKPIQVVERLSVAHKEMSDAVARQWHRDTALRMSIPARPEYDTDLIICGAIREAESVITEMYDACEAALEELRIDPSQPSEADAIDKLQAALKKARGEQ